MHKVLTNNCLKSIAKLYVLNKSEIMFDKKVFVEILKIFKEHPIGWSFTAPDSLFFGCPNTKEVMFIKT